MEQAAANSSSDGVAGTAASTSAAVAATYSTATQPTSSPTFTAANTATVGVTASALPPLEAAPSLPVANADTPMAIMPHGAATPHSSTPTPLPAIQALGERRRVRPAGILRLDVNKPRRSSGGSVEFRTQPQMLGEVSQ